MRELTVEHIPCPVCGEDRSTPLWSGPDTFRRIASNTFTYVRCGACGHRYLNPRPTVDEFEYIYPDTEYYTSQQDTTSALARLYAARHRLRIRRVLSHFDAPADRPLRVLELSCGSGFRLGVWRDAVPGLVETSATEMSLPNVEALRQQGHVIYHGGYRQEEVPRGYFDVVFSAHVIEHVPEPRDMLRAMAEYARPGGLVVVDTPSTDSLDYALFSRLGWPWAMYALPEHWHLFSAEVLGRMMRESGLEVVDRCSFPLPYCWFGPVHDRLQSAGWTRLAALVPSIDRITSFRSSLLDAGWLAAFTVVEYAILVVWGATAEMRLVGRVPA